MRKIILFILLFLVAKISFAQYPATQFIGAPNTFVKARGGIGADSSYTFVYNFADTTAANRGWIDAIPGAVIRANDSLYIRSNDALKWNKLAFDAPPSSGVLSYNWQVGGNYFPFIPSTGIKLGTQSDDNLTIITNGATRLILQNSGLSSMTGATDSVLVRDINGNIGLAPKSTAGGSVNSVGLSMPSAFTVSNSPITTSGTIGVTGSGNYWHYVNGLGQLRTFNQGYKDTGYLWLNGLTEYYCYSHSWAQVGAPTQYPSRVADTTGLTLHNRSSPGSGWYGQNSRQWADNFYNPARTNLVQVMCNEPEALAFNASNPQLVYTKVHQLSTVFFANAFMKSAVPMSDASVTKSGFGNATVNFANKSSSISGTLQVSVAAGSTAQFTATIATGKERIFIGIPSSVRGKVLGNMTITVDGSSNVTTFDNSEIYSVDTTYTVLDEVGIQVFPNGVIIGGGTGASGGLSVGSHTVLITTTSTDSAFIDYWGIIASPDSCKPVVCVLGVHFDEDNTMNATLGMRPYYNEYTDFVNTATRDAALDHFGDYPLSVVDPNQYFVPALGLKGTTDPVHPNAFGSSTIAKVIMDGIRVKRIDNVPYRLPRDVTLTGYLETTQVGFGNDINVVEGESVFTYNKTTDRLSVKKATLANGTLSDGEIGLNVTGILPAIATGNNYGAKFSYDGAGSSNQFFFAVGVELNAGYTGVHQNQALTITNASAGTGSTVISPAGNQNAVGNFGSASLTYGTTTGFNAGFLGAANSGDINAGILGLAQTAKNSAKNFGVIGSAINLGTSPVHVGGWFSLNQTTVPTVSAALIADNGSQTDPIFLGRDNNATYFSIIDGGNVGIGTASPSAQLNVVSLTSSVPVVIKGHEDNGQGSLTDWQHFTAGTVLASMRQDTTFQQRYFVGTVTTPSANYGKVYWKSDSLRAMNDNGVEFTLGAGGTSSGITIGTTTITSGTATRLLYETSGNVVGEVSGATSDGTNLFVPALYGGSAANDDIRIRGTTNGTKTSSYVTLQEDGGLTGIGTTTPTYPLHVETSTTGNSIVALFKTSGASAVGFIKLDGPSGAAISYDVATTQKYQVEVYNRYGGANLDYSFYNAQTTTFPFTIDGSTDNVGIGIGAAAPSANLHTGGTVRFANFGAGAATFDANGNVSSVSDVRLKNIQKQYTAGLSQLKKINPIVYKWNKASGMEMEHQYIGFSAQNILYALGEDAIGRNKDGYLSIQDRAILAALVNSVKELSERVDKLEKENKQLKNRK